MIRANHEKSGVRKRPDECLKIKLCGADLRNMRNLLLLAAAALMLTATPASAQDPYEPEPVDPSVRATASFWCDANANGVRDSGEKPLAGLTAYLFDTAGNPVPNPTNPAAPFTTTTDGNGTATFSGMAEGSYRIALIVGDTCQQVSGSAPGLDFPAGVDVNNVFVLGVTASRNSTDVAQGAVVPASAGAGNGTGDGGPSGPLAFTGSSPELLLTLAALALAAGVTVLGLGRRSAHPAGDD